MRCLAVALAAIMTTAACQGATNPPTSTEPQAPTETESEPTGTTPDSAPVLSEEPPELAWRSCGTGAQCTELAVPLDHDGPGAEMIELAVVRRLATGGDPVGVILLNPGGPGASGVEWLARRSPLPESITERFDLVSWDPRGVGTSAPIDCAPEIDEFFRLDSSPDDATETTDLRASARRVAEACDSSAGGGLLAAVGTDTAVKDLELLRIALGDEPLRFIGFSYGTVIALRYLAAHPDKVAAMVLDAVVDPTLDLSTFLADQTASFEAITVANLTACAGTVDCGLDDPLAILDEVFAAAETTPLQTFDGSLVGPAEVADAVIISAYAGDRQATLVEALARFERGDPGGLDRLADGYRAFTGWDAYLAVTCIDSARPATPDSHAALAAQLADVSPRLGHAIANELLPCAYWSVEPVESRVDLTVAAVPPILLVGGAGDPATPLAWAEHVHDLVPESVLIIHDAPGHTAIGRSGCIDDAVTAYIVDAALPTDGLRCG